MRYIKVASDVLHVKLGTVGQKLFYCKEKTQLTLTCSNSTIETLEKDVKYIQS